MGETASALDGLLKWGFPGLCAIALLVCLLLTLKLKNSTHRIFGVAFVLVATAGWILLLTQLRSASAREKGLNAAFTKLSREIRELHIDIVDYTVCVDAEARSIEESAQTSAKLLQDFPASTQLQVQLKASTDALRLCGKELTVEALTGTRELPGRPTPPAP